VSVDGVGMVADVEVGDWVSLHWDWLCDRLNQDQVRMLRHYTLRHLAIVNDLANHAAVIPILD
jgi:hypothetical protein